MSATVITTRTERHEAVGSKLLVVVLNYNTPAMTMACVRSLAAERENHVPLELMLVDNASRDDSVPQFRQMIRQHRWQSWVHLIASGRNTGFAGGNNLGIRAGPPLPYVLLLNSDTVVPPGTLSHCLAQMQQDPRIGALGCLLRSEDGSPQTAARRFPTPARSLVSGWGLPWRLPALFGWANIENPAGPEAHRSVRDVDWLAGAFLMLRREVLLRPAPLDEDFFFYGEDVELCHHVWSRGYVCRYDPRVSIQHLGGGSSTPDRLSTDQRNQHRWRARYLVLRKCHGRRMERLVRSSDRLAWMMRHAFTLFLRPHDEQKRKHISAVRQIIRSSLG